MKPQPIIAMFRFFRMSDPPKRAVPRGDGPEKANSVLTPLLQVLVDVHQVDHLARNKHFLREIFLIGEHFCQSFQSLTDP
jgi:hypothetical protein